MKNLIYVILIGTILLTSCGGNSSDNYQNTNTTIDKWYEGGSLHKAKISDWKIATEKNKLATCGDFMATTDNTVSMEVLKVRAEQLKKCIDTRY